MPGARIVLEYAAASPPVAYAEVDVLRDLDEADRAIVADWLDEVRRVILLPPFLAREGPATEWKRSRIPPGPDEPVGAARFWLGVVPDLPGRRAPVAGARGWAETLARVRAGEASLVMLHVGLIVEDAGPYGAWRSLRGGASLHVELNPDVRAGGPQRFVIGVGPEFLTPVVAVRLVDLVTRLARDLRATTGHLTLDRAGYRTAHEMAATGGATLTADLVDIDRFLRGYQWGQLLSRGHLEALGGRERVLAEAPVARAVDLSTPAWPLVYLQLTEDIEAFSDEELRRLKAYLAPLLHPADPNRVAFIPPIRDV